MANYQCHQIKLVNISNESLFFAYSLSFKVVQFIFQNNENCLSYDALNGHRYSKITKSRIFNGAFWGSHTINGAEIPLGHI